MKTSSLTSKQIELVKSAVGEMLESKALADAVKNSEQNLKTMLDNAGASEEDLTAIMNYFEAVQDKLDNEQHVGWW